MPKAFIQRVKPGPNEAHGLNRVPLTDLLQSELVGGVPAGALCMADVWGPAKVFGRLLRQNVVAPVVAQTQPNWALDAWLLLLRGMVCGVLRVVTRPLKAGGRMAAALQSGGIEAWRSRVNAQGVELLCDQEGTVHGVLHPEVFVFPAAGDEPWDGTGLGARSLDGGLCKQVEERFTDDPELWVLYLLLLRTLLDAYDAAGAGLWPAGREAELRGHTAGRQAVGAAQVRALMQPAWRGAAQVALSIAANQHRNAGVGTGNGTREINVLLLVRGVEAAVCNVRVADVPADADVFVPCVVDSAPPGAKDHRYPDSPLKGTGLAWQKSVQRVGPERSLPAYETTFRTGWKRVWRPRVFDRAANNENDLDLLIAIWPDFKVDGWKIYQVLFKSNVASFAGRRWGYRAWAQRERTESSQLNLVTQFSSCPEWLERVRTVGGKDEEIGLIRVSLDPVEVTGGNATVGVDFGTSNTCLAIKIATGNPSPIGFLKGWKLMWGNQKSFDDQSKLLSMTNIFGETEVPSELVALAGGVAASLEDPARVATGTSRDLGKRLDLISEGVLLSGFKWSDDRLWPQDGVAEALQPPISQAARVYLRLAIDWALAVLRARGVTVVTLRLGFPHAFGAADRKRHVALLRDVVIQVHNDTGVAVTLGAMVPESLATFLQAASNDGIQDRQFLLAIDVGGGTTDFAVGHPIENLAAPALAETKLDDIDAASVRMAGTEVLLAVGNAMKAEGNLAFTNVAEALRPRARALYLAQQIKQEDHLAIADEAVRARVSGIVSDAFVALIHFGLVMLASRVEREMHGQLVDGPVGSVRVGVILSGNGWRLLRMDDRVTNIEDFPTKVIRDVWSRLFAAGTTVLPKVDFKFVFIIGKTETANGMTWVPGVEPDAVEHLGGTREPVGVCFGQGPDPLATIGDNGLVVAQLVGVVGPWALPLALAKRLGNVKPFLTNFCAALPRVRNAVSGIEEVTFTRGPLRALYEELLPEKLLEG